MTGWGGAGGTQPPAALVLDPEASIRLLLVQILGGAGFAVCEAETVVEAMALMARRRFALAFIEVMLADGHGEAVADHLHGDGGRPVLMSGHPLGVLRGHATVHPLLKKPFRVKDVLRMAVLLLPG